MENKTQEQITFINLDDYDEKLAWKKEWVGMPEFIQEDLEPYKTIYVHFEDFEDLKKFGKLISKELTEDTKSTWFPPVEQLKVINKFWTVENA